MSTKTRWSLFGGAHRGAEIRLKGATEDLAKAQHEADRAKAMEWSYRMQLYGGPAQPSPTIGECLNSGYVWLQVQCQKCRRDVQVYLGRVKRDPRTPIWKLEPVLHCQRCRTPRYSPPVRLIKLNETQERPVQIGTREDRG